MSMDAESPVTGSDARDLPPPGEDLPPPGTGEPPPEERRRDDLARRAEREKPSGSHEEPDVLPDVEVPKHQM